MRSRVQKCTCSSKVMRRVICGLHNYTGLSLIQMTINNQHQKSFSLCTMNGRGCCSKTSLKRIIYDYLKGTLIYARTKAGTHGHASAKTTHTRVVDLRQGRAHSIPMTRAFNSVMINRVLKRFHRPSFTSALFCHHWRMIAVHYKQCSVLLEQK